MPTKCMAVLFKTMLWLIMGCALQVKAMIYLKWPKSAENNNHYSITVINADAVVNISVFDFQVTAANPSMLGMPSDGNVQIFIGGQLIREYQDLATTWEMPITINLDEYQDFRVPDDERDSFVSQ